MNPLWTRQVLAVTRLEVRKSLLVFRALPLYLLAGGPVVVVLLMLFMAIAFGSVPELETQTGTAMIFANLYQFILRLAIYAGCVWIFMNLFRGEVLDRSLHYYFLTPIRREVLVVGKFVAGWVSAMLLFGGSTLACLFMVYSHAGVVGALRHLLAGPGLGQTLSYVGVTGLACLGYGAVFLVVGLFFRNPIVPALMFWFWESINPFLPAVLKKISVIFYLQSLLPVTIDDGPFAVIADPVPVWLAVPGLVIFTTAILVVAGLRIRRMEIAYGAD